jgi:hypothetical protein
MPELFRSVWREAVDKELAGMRERRAFDVIEEAKLPPSARPIDLRFVFNDMRTGDQSFD